MTHCFSVPRGTALPMSLLGMALAVACSTAGAQQSAGTTSTAQRVDEVRASDASQTGLTAAPASLQIGDATRDLLALQRGGSVASATPRPIAGDIAGRSYQRYLKSFEHPIPQSYSTTVRSPNSGVGSP